jgi:hypothetical protein
MRFSKIIWKISPALLGMAALILIAGAAAGQENGFFNNSGVIVTPDEKYAGTTGGVDGFGSGFETEVEANCENEGIDIDYTIGCNTWHPDRVNLSTHQGQVDQKKKGNNAVAWIEVNIYKGVVDWEEELDCDKVQLKGKYNTKNETMDIKCTIKNCQLPDPITVGFINDAIDCAEAEQDSGDLGKRAGNLKLRGDLLSGHIRSKGTPVEP